MNGKRGAIVAQQHQIQGQRVFPCHRLDEVVLPDFPISRGDEGFETMVEQLLALDPEHRGGGEVGRFDQALAAEGEIAHRREIVEVDITVARILQLHQGLAQGLVLHFQLGLVHLELKQDGFLGGGGPQGFAWLQCAAPPVPAVLYYVVPEFADPCIILSGGRFQQAV